YGKSTRAQVATRAGVGAGDEELALDGDVAPADVPFVGEGGQRELGELLAGRRVEPETFRAQRDVDRVSHRDVVAAAGIGAGLVGQVAERLADAGQLGFPEEPAGVEVEGPQAVHALDEEPAIDDLRLRSVAVTRQDAVVRRAAEPEQPQGRLD